MMNRLLNDLHSISKNAIPILDTIIPIHTYVPLDLSKDNGELIGINITDFSICQNYIDTVLKRKQGIVAYGGYLEERNLYNDTESFTATSSPIRNIHLGIDFWCAAGTIVNVPLNGTVHSFDYNNVVGDYGPTIILKHVLGTHTFYTLYGHLSLDSLDGLFVGKEFKAGEIVGRLGTPDINVNYAPHLHFQMIRNLEGNQGDYPGVCAKAQLPFYRKNCPDPNLLLKLD
ncbi:peptidoglycan DD-metalloendopeptidase family protein [Maribacter sp. ACAM166]|uniref:peptidoglycan DD-metalloendopeptidase family protein n=1 Tax=Maribacter sp. ACAM166 TaxID=2508996 RepID=UPI002938FE39|nr:peptidoglycan DD-metalloendopeptidase family protein [Maribacter sp. ACAM166]